MDERTSAFLLDLQRNIVRPPLVLYRVQYNTSATSFGPNGLAAAASHSEHDPRSLQHTVTDHLNPSTMHPAPTVPIHAERALPHEYLAFQNVPVSCIRAIAKINLGGNGLRWSRSENTVVDLPHQGEHITHRVPQNVHFQSSSQLYSTRPAEVTAQRRRSRDQTFRGERTVAWLLIIFISSAVLWLICDIIL